VVALLTPTSIDFIMAKNLIVYFSRTGATRKLARMLAKSCEAELEEIREPSSRTGCMGYLRSALQAALHLNAATYPGKRRPGDYEIVIVGTPIWFWNMSSPVRTYLENNRKGFRKVAFFCTCGSSGHAKVLGDMERLCRRRAVATLNVTDAEVSHHLPRNRLHKFATAIQSAGTNASGRSTSPGTGTHITLADRATLERMRTEGH